MDKSRRVLVLGGNHDQVPYIKELKSRGCWIALTDMNANAPGVVFSDEFFQSGYDDLKSLSQFADQIKLSEKDYIFTASAQFAQVGASFLANKVGIPYPNKIVIETCLDKTAYYPLFEKNGLPIPKTHYIKNEKQLKKIINEEDPKQSYYMKSDFSKNPKYVYQFLANEYENENVFWGRDRYLQHYYVLQEEFFGTHLRLNMFMGNYNCIDFKSNDPLTKNECKVILSNANIIEPLNSFLINLGLDRFLVKFDVIVNGQDWCVLDIGLDPPSRMRKVINNSGHSFEKHYIDQYLDGLISYPEVNV